MYMYFYVECLHETIPIFKKDHAHQLFLSTLDSEFWQETLLGLQNIEHINLTLTIA